MDPLFVDGVDLAVVLIVLVKTVAVFGFLLLSTSMMIWFERKIVADFQNRVGPNVAGPWGLLQTLADGAKLFFKENLVPEKADRRVYLLAPFLSMIPAIIMFSIVPIGGVFNEDKGGVIRIFGKETYAQLVDAPIGILVMLACSGIAVYGIMLAGWSSGSKYPLLGSVRASAQMVSYEAALGLSILAVIVASDIPTLSTHDIVGAQMGGIGHWNILTSGVVPFVVFVIAATAEANRPPFDLAEAEQELVGGFHTEYSSIHFALFYIAEFSAPITLSGLIVTLFFGGPAGPLLFGPDWIWPLFWFIAKVLVFLVMFVSFRATLPRLRYDQLMNLGWRILIPLSLAWLLLIAALRIGEDRDWNPAVVVVVAGVVMAVGAGLLTLATRNGERRRELGEVEV